MATEIGISPNKCFLCTHLVSKSDRDLPIFGKDIYPKPFFCRSTFFPVVKKTERHLLTVDQNTRVLNLNLFFENILKIKYSFLLLDDLGRLDEFFSRNGIHFSNQLSSDLWRLERRIRRLFPSRARCYCYSMQHARVERDGSLSSSSFHIGSGCVIPITPKKTRRGFCSACDNR